MLFYRYLPYEFALKAIQEQRMKVGRIHELNDIFDCRPRMIGPPDMSEEEIDSRVFKLIRTISNEIGVLCYCATAENLLVWSHYGLGHKGMALGFELRPLQHDV